MTKKASDVLEPPAFGGGDSDCDAIFLQVGKALDAWENAEEILSDIFAVLTGGEVMELPKALGDDRTRLFIGDNATPARRAYGSIATFRGRKEMILAAGEAYFLNSSNKGFLAELKSLLKNANDLSARRNEIAHGVVKQWKFSVNLNGESADLPIDDTWYLVPALYNSNKIIPQPRDTIIDTKKGEDFTASLHRHIKELTRRGPGKYKYNSHQIEYYRTLFVELYHSACKFRDRLMELAKR